MFAPCLGRVPYLVTSARRAPLGLFLFRAGGAAIPLWGFKGNFDIFRRTNNFDRIWVESIEVQKIGYMTSLIFLVRAIRVFLQQRVLDIQRRREKARTFIFEFPDRIRLSYYLAKSGIERRHNSREHTICPITARI